MCVWVWDCVGSTGLWLDVASEARRRGQSMSSYRALPLDGCAVMCSLTWCWFDVRVGVGLCGQHWAVARCRIRSTPARSVHELLPRPPARWMRCDVLSHLVLV